MKHHYHLAATKVAFLEPENQAIGSLELNVMSRTKIRNITTDDLAKIQQVAQLQFFEKLGNPQLEVKDVFIVGISYLGFMSEKEFQATPKGMVRQERGVEIDPAVNDPFAPKQ